MLIKCLVMRDYGEAVRRGDGGMPFQPLASYCSQQKERDGRKE